MLKNTANFFYKKKKMIEKELDTKVRINDVLARFVREEVTKNSDFKCRLSYTVNKGVIKIETDSKLIAQEIALRIKKLEDKLKDSKIPFIKILI